MSLQKLQRQPSQMLDGDNFVNAIDPRMDERDFSAWLILLASENKEDYRFGKEMQYYTAAIEAEDAEGTP